MEYQIHVKKTYKNVPDIDELFFVNRSTDVILRNIENSDGNFPISNETLTEGINRYTLFLKELNTELVDISKDVETLKKEGVSSKGDCEECGKRIEELSQKVFAIETTLSNLAAVVGEHSSAIANNQASINELIDKVKTLEVDAELAHRSLSEQIDNMEGMEYTPVTEDQIASLFTGEDDTIPPTSNVEFVPVTEAQIASLFAEDRGSGTNIEETNC